MRTTEARPIVMGPRARALLAIAIAAVSGFAATTLWALEGGEVVVLTTFDAAGGGHTSRVWLAGGGGSLWIEAADPGKPFYLRIRRRPQVTLARGGVERAYLAEPDDTPAGHRRIRELLRARYGWRDRWVGLLVDTSRSVAVRLQPIEPAASSAARGTATQ